MASLTTYEANHRSGADLPAVPFTPYSEDVLIKLLRVDPVSGQLCVILSAPGGTQLGTHRHYGSVVVYTMKGAWRYLGARLGRTRRRLRLRDGRLIAHLRGGAG